jgi:uncharacterized protein YbbC (DUF1343 family)
MTELFTTADVETVVFDIQDVGSRFYTYIWTTYDLLASAARLEIPIVIADRPNPVTGTMTEGPLLDPAYGSFAGRHAIPIRPGLTAGELARHLNERAVPKTPAGPRSCR